jgi:allantoin racemase
LRIKIINPNTSREMTESIARAAKKYANRDTELVVTNPHSGPLSIDCLYEEALSLAGVLEEVQRGLADHIDGFVIACFNDPGLYAARELSSVPVVGIAESSFFFACMLGYRFSIISNLKSEEAAMWELVRRYGIERRCASVRPAEVEVLDCERDREKVERALARAGRLAIQEDKAEVLCLGCAGMAEMDKALEVSLGVPVIDPVAAGVKVIEGLVTCEKKTSKISSFRFPQNR